MTNIDHVIVSALMVKRDRGKGVTFDPSSLYEPSDKHRRSANPSKKQFSKPPDGVVACRHRDTHIRAECRLAKPHEGRAFFPKEG